MLIHYPKVVYTLPLSLFGQDSNLYPRVGDFLSKPYSLGSFFGFGVVRLIPLEGFYIGSFLIVMSWLAQDHTQAIHTLVTLSIVDF